MTKKKANKRSDELIDELLGKYGTSPEAVLGEKGLFMDLKRRIVERALAGDLSVFLCVGRYVVVGFLCLS